MSTREPYYCSGPDALEAAQRLLSEEAEEVARRRAEVLRIADEKSAAAGGVADAAQRYDQRRRDLSERRGRGARRRGNEKPQGPEEGV